MTSTLDSKPEFAHLERHNTADPDPDLDLKDAKLVSDNAGEASLDSTMTFGKTLRVYWKPMLYCLGTAVCAMGDGYQFKMPGNIVALRGFIDQMGDRNAAGVAVINPQYVAVWGGAYVGAQMLFLLVGNWPIDYFGRRPMLWLTQILMLAAAIIEMFATNWTHWLGAKILNGMSVGCNVLSATTYISEIAPTRARGAALGLYQLFWAIGSFAAAVGLQITSTLPTDQWRHAVYSMFFFLGCAFLVLIFLPESPRFYASRGNHEKGLRTLKRINGGVPGYDADHEYGIILKELEDGRILLDKQKKANVLDCFRGTNLRRTMISLVPIMGQLWFGSPVLFTYTAYFFQQAGLAQPFLGTVAVNTVLVAFVLASLVTTEKVGRRPLLVYAGLLMPPLLFGVGAILRVPTTTATGQGMIALACIWVAVYASSVGPLAYVYLAETSTVLLRGKTVSMGLFLQNCGSLVTSYCTPLMLSSPSFGVSSTMFFYGATGALFTVLIYFVVPETRNRSYVELDEMFEAKIPARKFDKHLTSIDRAKLEASSTIVQEQV